MRPNPARNPIARLSQIVCDHANVPIPIAPVINPKKRFRLNAQRSSLRVMITADAKDPSPKADTSNPYPFAPPFNISLAYTGRRIMYWKPSPAVTPSSVRRFRSGGTLFTYRSPSSIVSTARLGTNGMCGFGGRSMRQMLTITAT